MNALLIYNSDDHQIQPLKATSQVITKFDSIVVFKEGKKSGEEMKIREALGKGGYTLGLKAIDTYLDCYKNAKSSPVRCLASMANTANNLYSPTQMKHLKSSDNNCHVTTSNKKATLYESEEKGNIDSGLFCEALIDYVSTAAVSTSPTGFVVALVVKYPVIK